MKTKFKLSNIMLSIVLALVMVAGMLPMTALAAEEEVKYAVWIGGEEFTSEKLVIQGDTGTATYDPNTKTLTLDHYTYIGDELNDDWLSIIICAYDDLNIVLKGENKLISTCSCHEYNYGIYNGGGFTTITGEDMQNDSLLVQSKGQKHSMGIYTYSKGICVEDCTFTVKSELEGNSNNAMYFRGETTFRSCTVDVSCANGDGMQNGILVSGSLNIEESTVAVSVDRGEAFVGRINLNYPGGYAWKVSEDSEYSTEPFAYNQESYLAIKPEAFMATWTDGDGASYEKTFRQGEVITLPTSAIFEETFRKSGYTLTGWQGYTEGMTMPMRSVTFTAVYAPNPYTVTFDTNGAEAIDPITVTYAEKYGNLPSSAVTGLSGGNKNWYLVDAQGNVTDTNIKNLSMVTVAGDHTLFMKRNVLAPTVSIALRVPGGISDSYQYYIPGASQRILTATVGNQNTDILNYTYQWYKDGTLIEGATSNELTLDGNVSDSGTYKVEVTATLKDGTGIVVTNSSATGSKEQKVKILHAANTLSYDGNGGEGGPQSAYTGGTSLNISDDAPTREYSVFIGWNTEADGSGDSYQAGDVFTFANDNGNGGCQVTLYAQWKLVEYTVTYMADGEPVFIQQVEHGKDAALPTVPAKDGCVGKWDNDGKNITEERTISAVYTEIPTVNPDEVKPEDKTGLEETKEEMKDLLEDDSYTDENKEKIQDVIDDIDDALEVIDNVEAVEELIGKLPENITESDEAAIKAADDAYNALSDYEKSLVDEDAKKTLDDAKAALAELKEPADPSNPATGDTGNIFLWIALLFISGGAVMILTVVDKKRGYTAKR